MGFTQWFLMLYVSGLVVTLVLVVRALRLGRGLLYDKHTSTRA